MSLGPPQKNIRKQNETRNKLVTFTATFEPLLVKFKTILKQQWSSQQLDSGIPIIVKSCHFFTSIQSTLSTWNASTL